MNAHLQEYIYSTLYNMVYGYEEDQLRREPQPYTNLLPATLWWEEKNEL